MSKTVTKFLFLLIAASILALGAPAFAGSANDPVTGLPLPPGVAADNNPMSITICGKPAQANQAFGHATVADHIAWYKDHLPDTTWCTRSGVTARRIHFLAPTARRASTSPELRKATRSFP